MDENTAIQVANEIRQLFPHVGTIIVPSKNHFIVGAHTPKGDISSPDYKSFVIAYQFDWEKIKGALEVLAPQTLTQPVGNQD
jgi:hypothetical protein